MSPIPCCGAPLCQVFRSKLLAPVALLLSLVLMQMPSQVSPTVVQRGSSQSSKQSQQAWWSLRDGARPGEFSPLENVTRSENAGTRPVETVEVDNTAADQQSSPDEDQEPEAEEPDELAATKAAIIGDFVREHGPGIRRSRRHADLFDGSGYLIDLMDELNEFKSRANDEDPKNARRKRRSVPDAGDHASEDSDIGEDIPNFGSLNEALAFLEGGNQAEILGFGFNLRHKSDEDVDEGDTDGSGEEDKRRRRPKRSIGSETEPDVDADREKEAEESMARLDANLQELARYLEEEAEAEREEQQTKDSTSSSGGSTEKQREAIANFNRRLGQAYGNLVQLRNVASDLVTAKGPDQQQRMRHLFFPEKTAKWRIEADALRDNVRQLEKMYKQMDEL